MSRMLGRNVANENVDLNEIGPEVNISEPELFKEIKELEDKCKVKRRRNLADHNDTQRRLAGICNRIQNSNQQKHDNGELYKIGVDLSQKVYKNTTGIHPSQGLNELKTKDPNIYKNISYKTHDANSSVFVDNQKKVVYISNRGTDFGLSGDILNVVSIALTGKPRIDRALKQASLRGKLMNEFPEHKFVEVGHSAGGTMGKEMSYLNPTNSQSVTFNPGHGITEKSKNSGPTIHQHYFAQGDYVSLFGQMNDKSNFTQVPGAYGHSLDTFEGRDLKFIMDPKERNVQKQRIINESLDMIGKSMDIRKNMEDQVFQQAEMGLDPVFIRDSQPDVKPIFDERGNFVENYGDTSYQPQGGFEGQPETEPNPLDPTIVADISNVMDFMIGFIPPEEKGARIATKTFAEFTKYLMGGDYNILAPIEEILPEGAKQIVEHVRTYATLQTNLEMMVQLKEIANWSPLQMAQFSNAALSCLSIVAQFIPGLPDEVRCGIDILSKSAGLAVLILCGASPISIILAVLGLAMSIVKMFEACSRDDDDNGSGNGSGDEDNGDNDGNGQNDNNDNEGNDEQQGQPNDDNNNDDNEEGGDDQDYGDDQQDDQDDHDDGDDLDNQVDQQEGGENENMNGDNYNDQYDMDPMEEMNQQDELNEFSPEEEEEQLNEYELEQKQEEIEHLLCNLESELEEIEEETDNEEKEGSFFQNLADLIDFICDYKELDCRGDVNFTNLANNVENDGKDASVFHLKHLNPWASNLLKTCFTRLDRNRVSNNVEFSKASKKLNSNFISQPTFGKHERISTKFEERLSVILTDVCMNHEKEFVKWMRNYVESQPSVNDTFLGIYDVIMKESEYFGEAIEGEINEDNSILELNPFERLEKVREQARIELENYEKFENVPTNYSYKDAEDVSNNDSQDKKTIIHQNTKGVSNIKWPRLLTQMKQPQQGDPKEFVKSSVLLPQLSNSSFGSVSYEKAPLNISGIYQDNKISSMLPIEMTFLSEKDIEPLFYQKFAERKLICYDNEGGFVSNMTNDLSNVEVLDQYCQYPDFTKVCDRVIDKDGEVEYHINGSHEIPSSDYIVVDSNNSYSYEISCSFKCDSAMRIKVGLICFDKDKNVIPSFKVFSIGNQVTFESFSPTTSSIKVIEDLNQWNSYDISRPNYIGNENDQRCLGFYYQNQNTDKLLPNEVLTWNGQPDWKEDPRESSYITALNREIILSPQSVGHFSQNVLPHLKSNVSKLRNMTANRESPYLMLIDSDLKPSNEYIELKTRVSDIDVKLWPETHFVKLVIFSNWFDQQNSNRNERARLCFKKSKFSKQ